MIYVKLKKEQERSRQRIQCYAEKIEAMIKKKRKGAERSDKA